MTNKYKKIVKRWAQEISDLYENEISNHCDRYDDWEANNRKLKMYTELATELIEQILEMEEELETVVEVLYEK